MTAEPSSALGLLDVLEQLPRDDLRESVWVHLLDTADAYFSSGGPFNNIGRAFRLACCRSRVLADQLTTRMHVVCTSEEEARAQVAFLARQESLDDLIVEVPSDTSDAEQLIATILRLGGEASQQLRTLQLRTPRLTWTSGAAVRRYCPELQELVLDDVRTLDGSFFAPLNWCQHLAEVTFHTNSRHMECGAALQALARLPNLTAVTPHGRADADDLSVFLGALTNLQQLDARWLGVRARREDGARLGYALGTLTQLTELVLPAWGVDTDADCSQLLNSVTAQLGGLQQLETLGVTTWRSPFAVEGGWAVVLDEGFEGLGHLSAITELSSPPIAPRHLAASGRVPLLRELTLEGDLSSDELAATLRPLLPLASLEFAQFTVCLDKAVAVAGDDAAGVAASATWKAAALLAQAPVLAAVYLTLCCTSAPGVSPLSAGAVPAFLLPLRDCLCDLRLIDLPSVALEAAWPALCLATHLNGLHIRRCRVFPSGLLLAVGQHLPSLRLLGVNDCDGVTGATAVALAQVRAAPLNVHWDPRLDAEQRMLFTDAARPRVALLHC